MLCLGANGVAKNKIVTKNGVKNLLKNSNII